MSIRRDALLKAIVCVMAAAVVLLLGYALIRHFTNEPVDDGSAGMDFHVRDITLDGEVYSFDADIELILILGIDTAGYSVENNYYLTGGQADVIFIAAIDGKNEEVRLLQLDRDTLCEVRTFGIYGEESDTITAQLALSYAYGDGGRGSMNNAINSVSSLLEIPLTNCIAMTMEGLDPLFSEVGGINITLPCDCTWMDESYTEGKTVCLQGEQITEFLRARMNTALGTNRDRMMRHRAFVPAFFDTYGEDISSGTISFDVVYETISPYLTSNMTETELYDFFTTMKDYTICEPQTPDGVPDYSGTYARFTVSQESLERNTVNLCYRKENLG